MLEKKIFGIPGGGKTSYLSTIAIPDACEAYGPENVMVTSFTRSGAKEIASKKSRRTGHTIPIPEENIGTLHSICFHALQSPKIIETDRKMIQMWNEKYPDMSMSGKSAKGGDTFDELSTDDGDGSNLGDQLLNALNIKRNRMMLERNLWNIDLRRFEKRWFEFKDEYQVVDFTDLIDLCLKTRPFAPNMPKAFFVDEAQDCSKLQISLIRGWAQNMEELTLVGDDDQAIFTFSGATQDAFLEPDVPDEQKILLEQSYRCPVEVFERAKLMTDRLQKRQAKKYIPRRDKYTGHFVQGRVRESSATYGKAERMVVEAADIARSGKSVMIIASCSYMLDDVKRELRSGGVPFENRYRRTRKDWNPLYVSKKIGRDGTRATKATTVEMLASFLKKNEDDGHWTIEQLVNWAEHLKVGEAGLKRKIGKNGVAALKIAVAKHEEGLHTSKDVLSQIMTESACERALARDMKWFTDNIKSEKAGSDLLDYALKVVRTNGKDALEASPNITIGTIHSIKGSQSDVVFLFPDVSFQADSEMQQSLDGCDRAYRVFYVGMTRAYEELVLCAPNVKYSRQSPRMFVPL
jgi:DNA helicase II / ATP-dependent DNA helicase PcrA